MSHPIVAFIAGKPPRTGNRHHDTAQRTGLYR